MLARSRYLHRRGPSRYHSGMRAESVPSPCGALQGYFSQPAPEWEPMQQPEKPGFCQHVHVSLLEQYPMRNLAVALEIAQLYKVYGNVRAMSSFWEGLPKPFFIQAPMEDVTDAAFRTLIARFGKPDVMFTEFTSADGLVLAPEDGKRVLLKKLLYSEAERPIVAQLFSSIPERMEAAAKLCAELGFDGIDINMGCPHKSVEKGGAGAALIKNPANARALIRAAQSSGLPVSVKTRIGYNKDELDPPLSGESGGWLPELLAENLAAITLHARTRKEMSDVPAHWDAVARAVAIRNKYQGATLIKTLIVGNGDVKNVDEAWARVRETGCDGVMLGRAIYGNPWLFSNRETPPTPKERIEALIEHIKLFDKLLGLTAAASTAQAGDTSNFATMKKHFKAYISGWEGAKELRVRLMETANADGALEILSS